MKRFPIDLHLTEFISTGIFGFLKIGMTKEEIETQFFPPETWEASRTKEQALVWRYGNFELHFDEQGELIRIFNDYVHDLDGGESIRLLNPWMLVKDQPPRLSDVLQNLNELNLDFARTWNAADFITISIRNSKVQLSFYRPENEMDAKVNFSEYVLGVIWKGKA